MLKCIEVIILHGRSNTIKINIIIWYLGNVIFGFVLLFLRVTQSDTNNNYFFCHTIYVHCTLYTIMENKWK